PLVPRTTPNGFVRPILAEFRRCRWRVAFRRIQSAGMLNCAACRRPAPARGICRIAATRRTGTRSGRGLFLWAASARRSTMGRGKHGLPFLEGEIVMKRLVAALLGLAFVLAGCATPGSGPDWTVLIDGE